MAPGRPQEAALPAAKQRRRELQRQYEKASYYRKKNAVAELNAEMESLQREFQEITARRLHLDDRDRDLLSDAQTDTEGDNRKRDPAAIKRRTNAAVRRLYQMMQDVEALRNENAQLQSEINDRMLIEARIQQVIDMQRVLAPTDQPFTFVSLSFEVYSEIIAKAQDHALRFFYDDAKLSTGNLIFGWRDYRKPLEGDTSMFDYAFEQEFSSVSAADMVARTWELLSSADSYVSLYHRSLNPRLYMLEHINADTYLYYSILEPLPGAIAKTLYLVSRTAIANGYLIVLCEVDPSLIFFCESDSVDPKRSDGWQKMCSWGIVQDKGDGRTLFHFGGRNRIVFMLEVLLIVLRWQSKVIGPLMVLPPSDC